MLVLVLSVGVPCKIIDLEWNGMGYICVSYIPQKYTLRAHVRMCSGFTAASAVHAASEIDV